MTAQLKQIPFVIQGNIHKKEPAYHCTQPKRLEAQTLPIPFFKRGEAFSIHIKPMYNVMKYEEVEFYAAYAEFLPAHLSFEISKF